MHRGIENTNESAMQLWNDHIEYLQSASQQIPVCLQHEIDKHVNNKELLGNSTSNEIIQDHSTLEDQVADNLSNDGTSNDQIEALQHDDLEHANNNNNIDSIEEVIVRWDKDYDFCALHHEHDNNFSLEIVSKSMKQ